MSRQFTWWRRFWSTRKIPKQMLYKAASEFLQRIEFGEYEVCNLGREYYLEDAIYEEFCTNLKKEKPWLKEDAYDEQTRDFRKQQHKRKQLIMKAHLEKEAKMLNEIRNKLVEEFEVSPDLVQEEMENFGGVPHC